MFHNLIHPYEYQGKKGHLNTVNWSFLPVGSTKSQYEDQMFLEHQRVDLIKQFLESDQIRRAADHAQITIVPGWDCNLRCTHCVVIDKLTKPGVTKNKIDISQFKCFADDYMGLLSKKQLQLNFVGGEPLLYVDVINNLVSLMAQCDYKVRYGMTTNLAQPLSVNQLEMLKSFNNITVSIDGNEHLHNQQRLPIYDTKNVYVDVINNLKILAVNGLIDNVVVQAALTLDRFKETEHIKDFFKTLLKLGIKKDSIKTFSQHPTPRNPNFSSSNTQLTAPHLRTVSCCRHRKSHLLVNYNGEVCSDYYSLTKLGHVSDAAQSVYDNYVKDIDNLPVLNDDKCHQCDVLSFCWGGCTNQHDEYKNPSDNCSQIELQKLNQKSIASQSYNTRIKEATK
jgi:radical SAM protein with 4Fe4S-binding SPASM domain